MIVIPVSHLSVLVWSTLLANLALDRARWKFSSRETVEALECVFIFLLISCTLCFVFWATGGGGGCTVLYCAIIRACVS